MTHTEREIVGEPNLHPFRFRGASVALAHNGHLRDFTRMRYDLVEHVRPELAREIEGTTDSEWIYARVLRISRTHMDVRTPTSFPRRRWPRYACCARFARGTESIRHRR